MAIEEVSTPGVTAFYPMAQLPDGSWRIDGCYLEPSDENQV